MHLALGSGVRCVSIFTCTSPWEIYGYGLQKKIVSAVLGKFFYKCGYSGSATTAITLVEVIEAVMKQLEAVGCRYSLGTWAPARVKVLHESTVERQMVL